MKRSPATLACLFGFLMIGYQVRIIQGRISAGASGADEETSCVVFDVCVVLLTIDLSIGVLFSLLRDGDTGGSDTGGKVVQIGVEEIRRLSHVLHGNVNQASDEIEALQRKRYFCK